MSDIIHFSTDGWYARRAGAFTDENVARIADAAGRCWQEEAPGSRVYVGYDAREGAASAAELAAGVLSVRGLRVLLASRPLPTAAVARTMAKDAGATGCLVVTGSSYPEGYLGIKLRAARHGDDLRGFLDNVEQSMEPECDMERGPVESIDMLKAYIEEITSWFGFAGRESVRAVVYDAMYGVGSACVPAVLAHMGTRVIEIHAEGDDGSEDLCPYPVEPWIDECERAVAACDAVAGFATDSDGERMGVVDEDGRFVESDTAAALILGYLVAIGGETGRVVVNVASSTILRKTASLLGCRVTVKPVGYTYIYEELHRSDVLMATDGAGGICIPHRNRERDGVCAIALLVDLMARTGKSLKQLVAELLERVGEMSYMHRDVRLRMEDVDMLNAVLPGMNPAEICGKEPKSVSHMDGLRLEFDNGSWVLLRPSRIEPVVRIYAEAPTVAGRDALLEAAAGIARSAGR